MTASYEGHLDIVQELLRDGANADTKNNVNGSIVLHTSKVGV